MKRLATALVLVPVLTWLILAGPQWALIAVLAAIGLTAFYEYDQIAIANGIPQAGLPGMAAGLAVMLAPAPAMVMVFVALLGMLLTLRSRDLGGAMASAAAFTLGVIYIFGALRVAIELRAINPHWLMFALLLGWVGDTAALYIGRTLGRHALAPRISPAKTWEGAIGSVAVAVLAGAIYAHYLLVAQAVGFVVAVATAGNLAGQAGDLCESALKRGAGVKDSGAWLPGHGGWLDRIDSNLFAVPVVYALVKIFAQ